MAYYRQPAITGPGLSSSPGSGFHYNSPFGDTTFTKVFVGGLAWETQSETLRRYFEQFGYILEGVVITDKNTGRSKGYGFVTFRDHDSAKRACADPTPIIDGRRANCNLASLGRPYPSVPFGRLSRSPVPYIGGFPAARGAYFGGLGYQNPLSYMYQQGLPYASYGYPAYNSDYVYPQGVYNPYGGQQYHPMYGAPGTINTSMYPYNRPGQTVPAMQGYGIPTHQILQFGGPSVNSLTTSSVLSIQAPYPAGVAVPVPQTQLIAPRPPQFPRGTGTDQNVV